MDWPTSSSGALDAQAAFVIGGGDFDFGQGYTENIIRNLFKVPAPTLSNAMDLLREYLLKTPLEALQGFKDLLPDVLEHDFDTVASAVDKIMSSLTDKPLFFKNSEWQDFLDQIKGAVGGTVEDVVDKFDSVRDAAIAALRDILTGIADSTPTDLDNWLLELLTSSSDLDAGKLVNLEDIGDIAREKIEGLSDALANLRSLGQRSANLIADGDFDLPDMWFGADGLFSSDESYIGTHSWKLLQPSGGWLTLDLFGDDTGRSTRPVTGGQTFDVFMRVFPKVGNSGSGAFRIFLEATDSTGVNSVDYIYYQVDAADLTPGAWNDVTARLAIGDGYDTLQAKVQLPSSGGQTIPTGDTFYVDTASVREVTAVAGLQSIKDRLTSVVDATDTDIDNWLVSLASSTDFSDLLNKIKDGAAGTTGSTGTTLANVLSALQGHRTATTTAQSTATSAAGTAGTALTNAGTVIDNIVNHLGGTWGTGNAPADTAQPLADAAANIAAANAAIAALQNSNSGSTTNGKNVVVDFSTFSNSTNLPSIFTETYSANIVMGGSAGTGTYGITSGRAHVAQNGSNPRGATAIYNLTATDGDNQLIGGVWTNQPGKNLFTGYRAYNYLLGRSNAAGTACVYARLGYDSVQLGYRTSAANIPFVTLGNGGSGSFSFKAGAAYFLEIGTSGGSRIYRVWENSTVILTHTEVGTSSNMGASYRYCGLGADWTDLVVGQVNSADMLYFSFADTTPATYLGSVARFYRASTSTVSHTGVTMLANSFLDTTDYKTADITWTPGSNNTVTVSKEGVYAVALGALNANVASGSNYQSLVLYKNGSVARAGIGLGTSSTQPQNGARLQSMWIIYLKAGDTIAPGIDFSTAATIAGEATGTRTYFEIAKVA